MKARNTSPKSLSALWSGHGRIRHALLFTYRFSFRWFHDFVLPHLRKFSSPDAALTVIASRFGDERDVFAAESGDFYGIEEWASFRSRFKMRYLPAGPVVHHAKFMLLDVEGQRSPILAGGSANLTGAGWVKNAELWSWQERGALAACRDYLASVLSVVGADVVQPWIERLPRAHPLLPWLFGDKSKARSAARSYLCDRTVGDPVRLTVASPYFDSGSEELLEELVDTIQERLGGRPKVHLWVDGSGQVSRQKDYDLVMRMTERVGARVFFPGCRDGSGFRKGALPLHLKAIELLGSSGRRMLFGSANFTSAAWKGGNRETVFGDEGAMPLESILGEGRSLVPCSKAELRRLSGMALAEDDEVGKGKLLYWATYDEVSRVITLSVDQPSEVARVDVLASCHDRRNDNEKRKLTEIARRFMERKNWSEHRLRGTLLELTQRSHGQLPERASVVIVWKDGTRDEGPLQIIQPDFENLRDPETGIPWDLEDALSGVCAPRKPVASPLSRRTSLDMSEEPEMDEEEVEGPPDPATLSGDPEYDHEPDGVKLARVIASAKRVAGEREKLRRVLTSRSETVSDPVDKVLLEAARRALED